MLVPVALVTIFRPVDVAGSRVLLLPVPLKLLLLPQELRVLKCPCPALVEQQKLACFRLTSLPPVKQKLNGYSDGQQQLVLFCDAQYISGSAHNLRSGTRSFVYMYFLLNLNLI